jgi:phosphomannomutase/phosphoglucomutase
MPIRFGTDGWRAVISEEFTFDNVRRVAQAIAHFLRETTGGRDPVAVVGFDTRFLSDRYAIEVARVLAGNGITVHLTNSDAPTPAVSFAVKRLRADGGVMITASHNPPRYNGVKLKAAYGGSAPGDDCRRVETYTESLHELNMMDFEAAQSRGLIRRFDAAEAYLAHLDTLLDRSIVAARPGRLIVDPMYGAGRGYIARWLAGSGWETIEIRSELNPGFGSIHPEPIRKYLDATVEALTAANGAARARAFAVITDGDADRIGAIDERGHVLWGDRLMVVYARDILAAKPGSTIISEVKASQCLYDDITKQGGRPIMWKTGHSLIKAKMKSEQAVLAGEMSGHMFFADRYFGYDDAIYASCRLVEILAKTGKPLSSLVADLPATAVTPEIRVDTPDTIKFELVKHVQERLAGYARSRQPIGPDKDVVREVVTIDGVRAIFKDGWGLIRASNTQPALVLRFEAASAERLTAIRAAVEGELAAVKRTMLA